MLQKQNMLRAELAKHGGAGQVDRERGGDRRRDRARHAPSRSCSGCARELEKLRLRVRRGPAGRGRAPGRARPRARGEAAPLVENGKAAAEALRAGGRGVEGGRARAAARSTCCSSSARSWRRRWRAWPRPQVGELHDRGRRRRPGLRRLRGQLPGRGGAGDGARRRARSGVDMRALLGQRRRRRDDRPAPASWPRRPSWCSFVLSIVVKRLLYVSAPNEALIFSGRVRQVGQREVGYRVVRGGRAPAHAALRAGRQRGPHQHRHRHRGEGRLLQGRHPAERARRRQHQAARRGAAAQQRHRALPGPHAAGDHAHRQGDAGGQPARRAGAAHAGGGQPGQGPLRADAAGGGRARPEPHGPGARHAEDPEHHRRRRLPELASAASRARACAWRPPSPRPRPRPTPPRSRPLNWCASRDRQGGRRPGHRPAGDAEAHRSTRRPGARP